MVKIKLGLFEGIACCTIFPNIGLFFTMLILIISLVVPQKAAVYTGILVAFIVCVILLALSLLICVIIHQKSQNELTIRTADKLFQFNERMYQFSEVESCKYFVCKWYAIPFLAVYKRGQGGSVHIKLSSGEEIYFKVLYKDYLQLKKCINNIVEI